MHEKLKKLILEILENANLPPVEPALREIPFEGQLGLALSNVFQIARAAYPDVEKKELKGKAEALADLIATKLEGTPEFTRVESVNGYVNCFFHPGTVGRLLVGKILEGGTDWGKRTQVPGRVMVEYSQPNTHKAFHIGHVRNAVTGACLVRCFRYVGKETLAANYYGDIGSHVFKSLWFLKKHDPELKDAPDNIVDRGRWLGEQYRKAQEDLDEVEETINEAWELLKPLLKILYNASGDPNLTDGLFNLPFNMTAIARNDEDLFEGRAKEDINRIIDHFARHTPELLTRAVKSGIDPCGNDNWTTATQLADTLRAYTGSEKYNQVIKRESELRDIADQWNIGDPAVNGLWKETRTWSLDDFHRIYAELGCEFDLEFFESEVEEEGLKIVADLEKMGIVSDSNGAKIVEIDKKLHEMFGEPLKDKFRVAVLVRADGASLYGSKDLALARRKFEEYNIDESIYVVGNEQKFYFEQLFQILRLMGFPQWEKCFHLSYELVMLPSGKISSRKGQVILYDDVARELRHRALDVVAEKQPDFDENTRLEVSEAVAMGALIYGMLRVDTGRKIEFDFDEVLDFNGRSAPYIMYAATRARSIFRKAEEEGCELPHMVSESDFSGELMPVEVELIKHLGRFPDAVQKVVEEKKPVHLASYLYELATVYSDFYHQCPVLKAEETERRNRLLMTEAVRITLKAGLGLLGISAPDVM